METKLTQLARQAVLMASRRLDSEERLRAFMAHSRMMVAFYQAGLQVRLTSSRRR